MALKSEKVFKLLFVFWFLFYAVSPLTYHLTQSEDTPAITKKADRGANGLRLFLGELLWSKVFQQERSTDSPGNNRILIKKARAISNSNNDITKLKGGYAVLPGNPLLFSSMPLGAATVTYPHLYHFAFYHEFSGLSPPLV
jgi:hypothetical protein